MLPETSPTYRWDELRVDSIQFLAFLVAPLDYQHSSLGSLENNGSMLGFCDFTDRKKKLKMSSCNNAMMFFNGH